MISLDQVLLLEEKVESAVEKIQQLEAENDALRSKCSELTNALSAKTEQLKAYESEQSKIESGIIKAIDRLNSIENTVLKAAGQPGPSQSSASEELMAKQAEPEAVTEPVATPAATPEPAAATPAAPQPSQAPQAVKEMNFDSMETVQENNEALEADFEEEIPEEAGEESDSTDELGFDIF